VGGEPVVGGKTAAGPLVIGGTGGSGTRIIAEIADAAGWFMGAEVNPYTWDAMPFVRFDMANGPGIVAGRCAETTGAAFDKALAEHLAGHDPRCPWGWKHPHSYLLLPFLAERLPGMRFVHVVRDGRDVAVGKNQNQPRLYGDVVLGPGALSPVRSIRFWARANLRAATEGPRLLGERYLLVRLEDLCASPRREVARLLDFACRRRDDELVTEAARLVSSVPTIGRWRQAPPAIKSALREGDALARFGYVS
jgi:hypothetical protein